MKLSDVMLNKLLTMSNFDSNEFLSYRLLSVNHYDIITQDIKSTIHSKTYVLELIPSLDHACEWKSHLGQMLRRHKIFFLYRVQMQLILVAFCKCFVEILYT